MNSPLQHSGDENGSSASTVSNESVSESGSELQHSGDENDQGSCISVLESESELGPESESKSQPSQPSSNRATECGGTNSNFTLENFRFQAQLRPGDVEDDRLTLLQTVSDNLFGEAGTSWRQQLFLFCDCHNKNWQMKFKDPSLDCGRLGIIGLKAFVAAHNLQPPDVICFHQPAQPLHLDHYFVHGVKIRPRTVPQPAIAVGNDNGDDDDDNNGGGSEGGGDGEPNPSSGDGKRGGDSGPNSSNSDEGKGVDYARTRSGGGGSKRGESSGGKGKGVITAGNEKPATCLFEKQLTEKDVEGPSMEKPTSLLQADLWKDSGVLVFSDARNENRLVAFEFVM